MNIQANHLSEENLYNKNNNCLKNILIEGIFNTHFLNIFLLDFPSYFVGNEENC